MFPKDGMTLWKRDSGVRPAEPGPLQICMAGGQGHYCSGLASRAENGTPLFSPQRCWWGFSKQHVCELLNAPCLGDPRNKLVVVMAAIPIMRVMKVPGTDHPGHVRLKQSLLYSADPRQSLTVPAAPGERKCDCRQQQHSMWCTQPQVTAGSSAPKSLWHLVSWGDVEKKGAGSAFLLMQIWGEGKSFTFFSHIFSISSDLFTILYFLL